MQAALLIPRIPLAGLVGLLRWRHLPAIQQRYFSAT
jgi:hypothetical protein